MSYTISWFEEGQILLSVLSGDVTTEHIQEFLAQSAEQMSKFPSKHVYHLINMSSVQKFDLNLFQISGQLHHAPPNLAWSIIVLPPNYVGHLIRALGNSAIQFSPMQMRFFYSQDEALMYIHKLMRSA